MPKQNKKVTNTKRKPLFNRRNGRRRRNGADSAEALYETFHGRPSTETITVVEEELYRENLSALGKLQSIQVVTPEDLPVEITWTKDHPILACSPDGKNLYISGGDQSIDLAEFEMDGTEWKRDHMKLGVIFQVTYRTEKDFHRFETIDYYHNLGEETDQQPDLIYDSLNKRLRIVGGQYDVRREGIVN